MRCKTPTVLKKKKKQPFKSPGSVLNFSLLAEHSCKIKTRLYICSKKGKTQLKPNQNKSKVQQRQTCVSDIWDSILVFWSPEDLRSSASLALPSPGQLVSGVQLHSIPADDFRESSPGLPWPMLGKCSCTEPRPQPECKVLYGGH